MESIKLDKGFQRQREHLAAHSTGELSDEDIEHICQLWSVEVLEQDEEWRMEGLTDRDYRKQTETLNIVDAGGRYDLAKGNI